MSDLWYNRMPLGTVTLADTSHRSAINPASWLLDPTLDAFAQGTLKTRLVQRANESVKVLKSCKAQGMIAMALDGGRYETYLGCPELATTINPELTDDTVTAFFKPFLDAGLATGCVIRAAEFDFTNKVLRAPVNYLNNLRMKIRFASEHWKCKLFYVDTNVEKLGAGGVLPSWMFDALHSEFPGVLLIPEYGDESLEVSGYYKSTAPYMESFREQFGTPQSTLDYLPDAFSTVSVCDPADMTTMMDQLRGRLGKDILLFNGDFESPSAKGVRALYGL